MNTWREELREWREGFLPVFLTVMAATLILLTLVSSCEEKRLTSQMKLENSPRAEQNTPNCK